MYEIRTWTVGASRFRLLVVVFATAIFAGLTVLFASVDAFDRFHAFSRSHEDWELDEIASALLAALIVGNAFATWLIWVKARETERTSQALLVTLESERALRGRLVETEAETETKSLLMAAMGHELRTPMNSILGYAELLSTTASDHITRKEKDYLTSIVNAAKALLATIEQLLTVAKLEAKVMSIDPEPLDLEPMVSETCDVLRIQSDGKGLVLANDIAPDCHVFADPTQLRSILFNLIGNAIKYTDKGTVKVHARTEGDTISILVSDEGPGMTPAEIETAKTRYGRAGSQAESEHKEGTGLGLTIVERIMALHGGRMEIESTPGVGTTVIVSFPKLPFPPTRSVAA